MSSSTVTAMPAGPLIVAAAAVVRAGELLVVSKRAAPEVFYLPGGKPEPGESLPDAVQREVHEELGVGVATMRPFAVVEDVAALEKVPMRMTVYLAALIGEPQPAAELAALVWTTCEDPDRPFLAPALRNHVVPQLVASGLIDRTPPAGVAGP